MTTSNTPYDPSDPLLVGDAGATQAGSTASSTGSTTSSSSGVSGKAQQAAGTAKDEGQHVAGVAQGEAQKVASEARAQARDLIGQATSQVEDQSRTQRDRLVELLRSVGDDLEQMADNSQGTASDLVHEVAGRVKSVSSRVDGREPRELLDDVRGFARRKPGTFLLSALAAGVVAGRLTRGAKDAQSSGGSGSGYDADYQAGYASGYSGTTAPTGSVPDGYGTATGTPLAGTGTPSTAPAYPDGSFDDATGVDPLPNPAGSVAGETTWTDTRAQGDVR
jgi:hypothetical protein